MPQDDDNWLEISRGQIIARGRFAIGAVVLIILILAIL